MNSAPTYCRTRRRRKRHKLFIKQRSLYLLACDWSVESYAVILRGGAVVVVAPAQFLGQSLQSVLLVQPGHTFLNE